MKVLLLGGGNFVGPHIIESLLEKNHKITIVTRGKRTIKYSDKVETLIVDRSRPFVISGVWDCVIDTSTYVPSMVKNTINALKNSEFKKYIFLSSISVYKDYKFDDIKEDYKVKNITESEIEISESIVRPETGVVAEAYPNFGGLRALCERVLEEEYREKMVIARIGLLCGPYDYSQRVIGWLKRIKSSDRILVPGRAEQPVQLLDVRDLARWVALNVDSSSSGIFNLVGKKNETFSSFLNEVREVLNVSAELYWLDDNIECIDKELVSKFMPWLPMRVFPLHTGFYNLSNSKSLQFGLSYTPLKKSINDIDNWLLETESY
ncbi:hypothetical protein AB4175_16230 [Vibrio cyclitrophicus]